MLNPELPVESVARDLIAIEASLGAHNYKPLDVVLSRGEGVWLWDTEGKRYLDCLSAYSAVNQGHCHPKILAAMVEQAQKLDAEALARARARCPDVPLIRGDACALPVRSGTYDLVVCLEVLEHLPDPAPALEELLRVTRRGCLLSVPHEPFFRLGNLLRGKNLTRLGNPSDHLQHWGGLEFEALCRRYFTVRACGSSFPWLIVYGTRC